MARRTAARDRAPAERLPPNPRGQGDARKRRALEGELISHMRTQARRRHEPSAVARRQPACHGPDTSQATR
jgi:hypothetical protein